MLNKLIISIQIIVVIVLIYLKYYSDFADIQSLKHPELEIIVKFIFYLVLIDFARRIIGFFYSKKNHIKSDQKDNFLYGLNNIAKLLVGLGAIATMFAFFGVDIKSLLTSLSIVAAAIAIITRDYISDFLVGIYFSFSKDFEINDYVRLGEHKGKIIELKMLKVKLLNDDDDLVIIPNGKIYMNEIINYTKRDIRLMSIDFQIDINTVKNIELLESELITSLNDFKEFIEPQSFNLKIVEMTRDAIDLKFQYTLKKLDRDMQRDIRRNTVRQVFNHISGIISSKKDHETFKN